METTDYIEKLFYPKSIAIIGASSSRLWQIAGIINRKFEGDFYLVTKKEEEILGIKCYQDFSELPDKIDHVIIAVNRNQLKETIKQCIEKNIYTIHIFTAGGAEFDEEGVEIEREVHELIKKNNIYAIGPNCMGVYCPEGKIAFTPDFSEKPGDVAFVSQSGDLTTQFITRENNEGVYFSKAASIGNSIDLKISDFIDYFSSDEKTRIIAVYFEGFARFEKQEGKRLWKVLKKNKKPLLLLRGGITEQGKRAAASHTGTIASDNRIWEALYKQTSAFKISTWEELLDSTIAFSYCKDLYPKVKSVILIGWSGGKLVLSTDQLSQLGILVPEIKEPTKNKMKDLISTGSVNNPIDLPWIGDREKYSEICRLAIEEDYIGGCILETGPWHELDERFFKYFGNIVKVFEYCKHNRKPILISLPHSILVKQREQFKKILNEKGIPVFPTLLRTAKAFLNLFEFQRKCNF